MHLDKYSNPIFTEKDLFEALYQGYELNPNDIVFCENSSSIQKLEQEIGHNFQSSKNLDCEIKEYDSAYQQVWYMPEEYKNMDIEGFLVHICPKENYQRLITELQAFRAKNMLDLLRWLKYFVDTCRQHNIVWGVGRGSSVASYVLFLIGVHKIDSIKYKLDWQEFLR